MNFLKTILNFNFVNLKFEEDSFLIGLHSIFPVLLQSEKFNFFLVENFGVNFMCLFYANKCTLLHHVYNSFISYLSNQGLVFITSEFSGRLHVFRNSPLPTFFINASEKDADLRARDPDRSTLCLTTKGLMIRRLSWKRKELQLSKKRWQKRTVGKERKRITIDFR